MKAAPAHGAFEGRIRPFDPHDMTGVQDFWVASWTLTMPEIDFDERRPWLAAHLESMLAEGTEIRVAVAGKGQLAGFVTVDPANGHLDQICVASDWWGHGVAEALLAVAREISPTRLTLDVNSDNARAIAFYVREGFEETGKDINQRSGLPIVKMAWTRG
jgi:putative acetyltransferase